MKALKIILVILLLLVALVGGGLYYLFSQLDSMVVSAIEKVGSEVTQTEVRVDRVNFELTKGRGEIYGLSIANPEGYTSDSVFKFDEVALQIEPTSIAEPVIVLNEVLIDGAVLTAEHNGGADTNIQQVLKNVQSYLPADNQTTADEAGAEAEVRFMVEKLSFSNISMRVISPQLEDRTVKLNDIKRTNLGSRKQGLTAQELAQAIVQPLIDEAQDRVEGELKHRAVEAASKALDENLSDSDKEKLDKVKELFKAE
ncbi:hypothetical protein [Gilvimarinus polysaccharolyticus]|uniref:hypothetical protein n=1 Tax=Gilvimarinus polysaccharolyticus TaxID=863921 RepID=UPI000673977A|nr:hypothetical protein [Gilvimarinus polysaccharolyticus]